MSGGEANEPAYMTIMRESFAEMHKVLDRASEVADMPDCAATLRAHEDRITKAERELTRAFRLLAADGISIPDLCRQVDVLQETMRALILRISDNLSDHMCGEEDARQTQETEMAHCGGDLGQDLRVPAELSEDEYFRLYDRMVAVVNQFAAPLRRQAQRRLLNCAELDVAVANLHAELRKAIEHLDPNRVPF